ncbi:MAG: hypothetical protein OER80_12780 [Gammaproteobacteria bacterium]|nr:hypothetical protein [Gammaproteobacteria bacterium]MDH3769304.1 hypothetical protein [Gammaproteobacteria bacterium]
MSVNDLIAAAAQHPLAILLALGPLPVLAWLVGRFSADEGERSPWKYLYSVLVYAACIPGILAAVLTGYSLFFIRANLLQVNILIYGLPIVIMILTLVVIGRYVDFARVPGFDRLSGLMLIIGISFAIALFIVKTRIWIFFGSSIATLFVIAILAFILLKWGSKKLFR